MNTCKNNIGDASTKEAMLRCIHVIPDKRSAIRNPGISDRDFPLAQNRSLDTGLCRYDNLM